MFVIGVGTDTAKNEYWEDNLSLALQIQRIADSVYPGLFRPMIVRNSVYNQDLNKFSLLIEVGATGNTIDQALLSTRCLTNVLNILYKN
ncbi:Stage II sporulation protein P (SpoIIP) [compost metagenome]